MKPFNASRKNSAPSANACTLAGTPENHWERFWPEVGVLVRPEVPTLMVGTPAIRRWRSGEQKSLCRNYRGKCLC